MAECQVLQKKNQKTKTDLLISTSRQGLDIPCKKVEVAKSYALLISEGFVTLPGTSEKIPVQILRDTGATQTWLLESALLKTKSGNQHFLTIMCLSTCFPEAIPLRNIKYRSFNHIC